ncbi:MAG: DUF192 domain-containing protein [Candidatus Paceibacterota bacterium]
MNIRRFIIDIIILGALLFTFGFLYTSYKEVVYDFFFSESSVGIFIRDIPITVAVADSPDEHAKGLSGVASLGVQEGKLFLFDKEGRYGIWMKDMLIPIDIIWIDNSGRIVHIEENILPESYPTIYSPPVPARFVLEVNAFFVDTFNIQIGDMVTIPSHRLPADLQPY